MISPQGMKNDEVSLNIPFFFRSCELSELTFASPTGSPPHLWRIRHTRMHYSRILNLDGFLRVHHRLPGFSPLMNSSCIHQGEGGILQSHNSLNNLHGAIIEKTSTCDESFRVPALVRCPNNKAGSGRWYYQKTPHSFPHLKMVTLNLRGGTTKGECPPTGAIMAKWITADYRQSLLRCRLWEFHSCTKTGVAGWVGVSSRLPTSTSRGHHSKRDTTPSPKIGWGSRGG